MKALKKRKKSVIVNYWEMTLDMDADAKSVLREDMKRLNINVIGNAMKLSDKKAKKKYLKPFNSVIQVCPCCGKVDVYKNDGHSCSNHLANEENRRMSEG